VSLHLARHGRTAYNDVGRFQGWLPVPLDETGREQARALGAEVAALAPVTLVCSHIARARETADIVGAAAGLEPVVDERFAETDCGDWTDRLFTEVMAEDPEGFRRFLEVDLSWGFPGGETFLQQQARVLDAVEDWRGRREALPAVVVCHGNTIRLALAGLSAEGAIPARPDNGSLVAL
jgi:broad specificity phosphatase PhoE